MNIRWKRGHDEITYTRPSVWFGLGIRGSGKSSVLEDIGEGYLKAGNSVLDLFGSRDGEALAWLRSEWAKNKNILLLKGDNVDVKCSFNTQNAGSLTLGDIEKYDLIISASPLYLNIDQEFFDAAKIEDVLYRRLHFKKIVYLCCREASNFYYSRLKVSDNQLYAKAQMVYLIRESRHMGVSLGLDSLRSYAIDIDIRSLSDYLFLKTQGVQGLSRELKWLYQFVDAKLLRNLSPKRFVIVSKNGAIGYGTFPEIPWHKQEGEDILEDVGIKVEYGEELEEGIQKGTYSTVGDREHSNIIKLYIDENLGMAKVADRLKRSIRTVEIHVKGHNKAVLKSGFCAPCKRMQSPYFDKEAHKGASTAQTP